MKKKGDFIMDFTDDDKKMKEVNNKVRISLLCDKSELINDKVIDHVNKNEKEKAIDLLEKYINELKEFEDLDEAKLITRLINDQNLSLEELKKKKDYKKEQVLKFQGQSKWRNKKKEQKAYDDAIDSDED
jgi:hypothetical protein